METPQKVTFEISIVSVLKILALLAGLWLMYQTRNVLVLIVVALIISVALNPFVARLAAQGVPRALSVIVLYAAFLVLLGVFVYFVIPPVVVQIKEIALNLPFYTNRLGSLDLHLSTPTVEEILGRFSNQLSSVTGGLVKALVSVFGGVISALTVFALTFYFLLEEKAMRLGAASLIPPKHRDRFQETAKKVSDKLGDWLRGQMFLMFVVGLVDAIALGALAIPFALTLGVLSGVLELIPVVGPIIAGFTAVFVAFASGAPLWKVLAVVIIYILVQQLEGQILVPKVMQKTIGLSPVVVILAILIGNELVGIGGAFLAVPVAAAIQVFFHEYIQLRQAKNST